MPDCCYVQAIFEYTTQLPSGKGHAKLRRLLEAVLGSSSSSNAAADLAADIAVGSTTGSDYASSLDGDHLQTDSDAAVQLVMGRAAAAAASLRDLMRSADLITLAPGMLCRFYSSSCHHPQPQQVHWLWLEFMICSTPGCDCPFAGDCML